MEPGLYQPRHGVLRHLGLWQQGVRVSPTTGLPESVDRVIEFCFDDPFPDYDTEPVNLSSEALA